MKRIASVFFFVAMVATLLHAPAWGFQGKTPPAGVTPTPSVVWSPSPTPTLGTAPAPTPVVDPSPTPQPQAEATPPVPSSPKAERPPKGNTKKAPAKRAMGFHQRKSIPPVRVEKSAKGDGHLDVVEGPAKFLTIWSPNGKGGFYPQAKGPIVKPPGDKGKSGENPASPKPPNPAAKEEIQWDLLILTAAGMSFLLILARNR